MEATKSVILKNIKKCGFHPPLSNKNFDNVNYILFSTTKIELDVEDKLPLFSIL